MAQMLLYRPPGWRRATKSSTEAQSYLRIVTYSERVWRRTWSICWTLDSTSRMVGISAIICVRVRERSCGFLSDTRFTHIPRSLSLVISLYWDAHDSLSALWHIYAGFGLMLDLPVRDHRLSRPPPPPAEWIYDCTVHLMGFYSVSHWLAAFIPRLAMRSSHDLRVPWPIPSHYKQRLFIR